MKRTAFRGWVLLALAGLAVAIVFGLVREPSSSLPAPPRIATEGLDAPVIRLWQQLEAGVRARPRDDTAWGALGMMLRAHEFDREAAICLAAARDLNPNEPRWPYHLAQTLMDGDPEEALRQLRRAVELCGDDKDYPRLWLGRLLVERGQLAEAEALTRAWLSKQPTHAGARLLQAQIAFARQAWEDSARSLAVCVTNRFTARQAYALLGQIYLRLGRDEDTALANRYVQSMPPDDPWPDPFENELAQFRVSRRHLIETVPALLARNELGEAERLTRRLLEDFPDAPEGWLYQGRLRYLAQDWRAAEEALRRHLQLEPDSVDGLMQLGQLRLKQDQPLESARHFSRVVQLKPDAQIAHYQLGEARLRSGDTNAAVASLRDAIQCDPAFMESYLRLANVYFKTGRREEAVRQLNEAMRINPSDMRVQEALEFLQGQ